MTDPDPCPDCQPTADHGTNPELDQDDADGANNDRA